MKIKPALVVLLIACVPGCQRDDAPARDAATATREVIRIVGSSTMAPVVSELAKAFQAMHPGIRLSVESGGSGRALAEMRAGKADLGMVSRALTDQERDLVGFSIARDGICFIVHRENPVDAITSAQVVGVFAGRTATWKQLGGGDRPIVVITRPEGRSALEVFAQHFKLRPGEIRAAASEGENDAAMKLIAGDRGAITFVSVGEAERQQTAGLPIKRLAVDGITASSENIRTGKYRFSRSLTLVTRTLPSGATKSFIDFALSPQAAPIIKRYDFVSYVD